MKTRNIALVLFAGVALLVTSCINEKEGIIASIGENDIAFKIAGIQTKATPEDSFVSTETIASFKFGKGDNFSLEEEVMSLDGMPATKGTPAFTENVASLYGSFNAVANPGADNSLPDANFPYDEATNLWTHHYHLGDIWEYAPLHFYMRMPAEPAGVSGDYTYNSDGSIEFDYTSPSSATAQQDILFTSTTMTKETENGKSITFYHALTGIKFSNFYTNKGITGANAITKTIIKEVTISGVKNTGHCKMVLENASSSKTVAQWSGLGIANNATTTTFTVSCSDTTNYKNGSYGLDTLLDENATARNINDNDGSFTLWLIPQTFAASDVTIKVKCDVELVSGDATKKTYEDEELEVSLGARTWKAGELHTFTLKPVYVGVELEDEMSDDKFTKSSVRVDNTGNVFEYVRVNLIGNWVGEVQTAEGVYNEEETILNGYTTSDDTNTTLVEAWNDKDGYTSYGTFENLVPKSTVIPATAANTKNNWVRYDKYYYYIKPIGPNDAVTDQLFSSYTVGVSPEYWIPDKWGIRRKARNVHLVMDLMVQAIPAPVDENGNVLDNTDNQGYIRAWVSALGKTSPSDLLDL